MPRPDIRHCGSVCMCTCGIGRDSSCVYAVRTWDHWDMASSEIRRRNVGGTFDTGIEEPEQASYSEDGEDAFREGLELYSQAEQSNFQNTSALTKSIKQVIEASEKGVEEASIWMKSFLDSRSALPSSVVLPDNLVRTMQVMSDATPTEKQVRLAAKSMFHKMAGEHDSIPRNEISQKAKMLLESEEAVGLRKSSKVLESSVSRLLHDALVINQTDKVCVNNMHNN